MPQGHCLRRAARHDVLLTLLGLALTAFFSVMLVRDLGAVALDEWSSGNPWHRVRFLIFATVIAGLGYGVVVYFLSRLGYYTRIGEMEPRDYAVDIPADSRGSSPSVAILVPSYKEDGDTIRQTLISAALQDYAGKRLVLLIDDSPNPRAAEDAALLAEARRAPADVTAFLACPRTMVDQAWTRFLRLPRNAKTLPAEVGLLRGTYRDVGQWLVNAGQALANNGHTTRHFGEFVLRRHGEDLIDAAENLVISTRYPIAAWETIGHLYAQLAARFDTEITSFERKRFVNLGHAANKAANLNAYIGLLGGNFVERGQHEDTYLYPSRDGETSTLSVKDADYVITIDADSLVGHDYARRLIAHMEAPGNHRVAVAQTPYSAIPGARSVIERIAGATTDVQYIVHQGFTWLGATFWVGANAVLRRTALDDIRSSEIERGHEIPIFVQDRTVIEDTESTIDLVARGWELHNEPSRLAYSATPPDFGSLLIQRRRWANGGILILPKMLRYAVRPGWASFRAVELFVRAHYLLSPAISSITLLLLITLPVGDAYLSPWLAIAGVPYLALYGRDLAHTGYGGFDLARVFAFNWILLPVNLAGVIKSVEQGITGKKIPFGRTPKVEGRTASPAWAIASLGILTVFVTTGAIRQLTEGQWILLGYSVMTLGALLYGWSTFVGWRAAWEDLRPWRNAATQIPKSRKVRFQAWRRLRRMRSALEGNTSSPDLPLSSQ